MMKKTTGPQTANCLIARKPPNSARQKLDASPAEEEACEFRQSLSIFCKKLAKAEEAVTHSAKEIAGREISRSEQIYFAIMNWELFKQDNQIELLENLFEERKETDDFLGKSS